MRITISEYAEAMTGEVKALNDRLRAGGVTVYAFPESPVPVWLPKIAGRKLFQECYVAADEEGAVRGGYILKHQEFWIRGKTVAIADLQLPISEGTVNKAYPQVGVQLLLDAQRRQPLLFGLGIGSYEEPLTRLLRAAGWEMVSVPFFFRVTHPFRFLRNIAHLRRTALGSRLMDLLAFTGLGWLAIKAVQVVRSSCRTAFRGPRCRGTISGTEQEGQCATASTEAVHSAPPDDAAPAEAAAHVATEIVDEFSDWADALWEAEKSHYGTSAVRDCQTLRILYPKRQRKFIRLKVRAGAKTLGWAVLLNTQLAGHQQFGSMRLGTIVDCFAAPADAGKVVRSARTVLEGQGVDLIVSNQSHAAWCAALADCGFLHGPSNFIMATSKQLSAMLKASSVRSDEVHVNRGDGDGPINL